MHSLRPYVFLSYSRADDEPFVEHLRARLEDAGISVWWDRASMESRGRRFLHEIQEAIEHCDRLIAVIGPGALSSPYVRYEWEHALLFARAVTPVLRLVNYKEFEDQSKVRDVFALNDDWSKLHCVDFRASRPFDEACEELLRIARTLAAPLGNLYGVPALPPNLLPRPEQLQAISDGLLSDLNAPHAVTSSFAICASHGMGGAGKPRAPHLRPGFWRVGLACRAAGGVRHHAVPAPNAGCGRGWRRTRRQNWRAVRLGRTLHSD